MCGTGMLCGGNGMLCVELAREGFTRVVGVDYCQQAVDLARQVGL
jgi:2-polyprenyl-3-methyl-5-hydroxy-6-metoxy-1,4-benzoquinol methylase